MTQKPLLRNHFSLCESVIRDTGKEHKNMLEVHRGISLCIGRCWVQEEKINVINNFSEILRRYSEESPVSKNVCLCFFWVLFQGFHPFHPSNCRTTSTRSPVASFSLFFFHYQFSLCAKGANIFGEIDVLNVTNYILFC